MVGMVQLELALSLLLNLESMPELHTVDLDLSELKLLGTDNAEAFWEAAFSILKTLSRLKAMNIHIHSDGYNLVLSRYAPPSRIQACILRCYTNTPLEHGPVYRLCIIQPCAIFKSCFVAIYG